MLAGASCRSPRPTEDVEERVGAVTTPAPALSLTATITTPHLISPLTVTLGSTGTTTIYGATKITRPGTAPSLVTNMGSGGVDVEPDAVLGDLWSTSTVTLKDRVHLIGKVVAPQMIPGNGVKVDQGVDTTTPLLPATVTSWPVNYPSAVVTDVVAQNNGSASPAPGRFGKLQVFGGCKLTLKAGSYFVDSLDLESGSSLILDQDAGPVLLYVLSSVIMRGTLSTISGKPSDLLIGYLGTAEMIVEMPFTGTIVAPSAKLTLRSVAAGYSGAFFGKNIEVGPNTTVSFRPGQAILSAQPAGTFDACAIAIQPSDGLTGAAREVQYQQDILRFCTGIGISSCEQTIRARMNVDFFMAAASMLTNRISTGTYQLVLKDRDAKLKTFRHNPTLACDVAAHDGDGDYVPDSADACKNTPPLTPVLANGCTNTQVPAGADIAAVQGMVKYLGVSVDPRCIGAPRPPIPAPLGAFRTGDPTLGKAIWISRDPGTTTCPLYYQVEVSLTDGTKPRSLTFQNSEDTTLPWITRPPGAVQFNIHSTDPANRGAWGSYGVFTRTFRVRTFNFAGQSSEWSDWFVFGRQDCVAGQPCQDL
jgi:hypothetical protein